MFRGLQLQVNQTNAQNVNHDSLMGLQGTQLCQLFPNITLKLYFTSVAASHIKHTDMNESVTLSWGLLTTFSQ